MFSVLCVVETDPGCCMRGMIDDEYVRNRKGTFEDREKCLLGTRREQSILHRKSGILSCYEESSGRSISWLFVRSLQ